MVNSPGTIKSHAFDIGFSAYVMFLIFIYALVSCGGDDDDSPTSLDGKEGWETVSDPLTGLEFRCNTIWMEVNGTGGPAMWCYPLGG